MANYVTAKPRFKLTSFFIVLLAVFSNATVPAQAVDPTTIRISGLFQYKSTLTADFSMPSCPTCTFKYRWLASSDTTGKNRSSFVIVSSFSTSPNYIVTFSDIGKVLALEVRAITNRVSANYRIVATPIVSDIPNPEDAMGGN